jgi:hypothetical protein
MNIKTITIKPGYSLKEIGGEFCIVFDAENDSGAVAGLPSLNESGIFLWDRLMKNFLPNQLVTALMERNHLEYEDALEDVGEFLAKLINGNIAEVSQN